VFSQRICVLGGSGTLGKSIVSSISQKASQVSYTARSERLSIPNVAYINLDLTNPVLEVEFFDLETDVLVFAAGLSASDLAGDKGKVFMANEKAILTRALELGKKVVCFSSSRVAQFLESGGSCFDSQMMAYIDHKLEIENICGVFESATVFRPGKVISKNFPQYRLWSENLSRGEVISVSSGIICNPVHIQDITVAATRSIFENHPGIYELWCENQFSYLEIAKLFFDEIETAMKFEDLVYDTNVSLPGVKRKANIWKGESWMKLAWESCTDIFQSTLKEYLNSP